MIIGKLINLRLVNETDIEQLHKLQSNVTENGPYNNLSLRSIVHLRQKYTENGLTTINNELHLITDKEDNIVGNIHHFKSQPYSTGYELGAVIFEKKNRGKGYASEALKLYTAYVFETRPIRRLELATSSENIGAQKVAKKCGYTFEGINRKVCYIRGVATDLHRYSILREEAPKLDSLIGE